MKKGKNELGVLQMYKSTLVIDRIKGKPELLVNAAVQLSFTMSLLSVPLVLQVRLSPRQAFPSLMEA